MIKREKIFSGCNIICIALGISFLILAGCSASQKSITVTAGDNFSDEQFVDSLMVGGVSVAGIAQNYYLEKKEIDGHGSFSGFSIPDELAETDFGYYEIMTKGDELEVICKAKRVGQDGESPIEVHLFVSPGNVVPQIMNYSM